MKRNDRCNTLRSWLAAMIMRLLTPIMLWAINNGGDGNDDEPPPPPPPPDREGEDRSWSPEGQYTGPTYGKFADETADQIADLITQKIATPATAWLLTRIISRLDRRANRARLSYTQLMELTGIRSRETLARHIRILEEAGILQVRRRRSDAPKNEKNEYALLGVAASVACWNGPTVEQASTISERRQSASRTSTGSTTEQKNQMVLKPETVETTPGEQDSPAVEPQETDISLEGKDEEPVGAWKDILGYLRLNIPTQDRTTLMALQGVELVAVTEDRIVCAAHNAPTALHFRDHRVQRALQRALDYSPYAGRTIDVREVACRA